MTIADVIGMTRLASPDYHYEDGAVSPGPVAQFSPNGKRFVVVLRRGNLERNTNEYSMLLWKTDEVFGSPAPERLVTLASSSNRPAIEDVRWLPDNETIVFLGEAAAQSHQLYSFDLRSSSLRAITSHPTDLVGYSLSADGKKVAYVAESAADPLLDDRARHEGVVVSTERLLDLVSRTRNRRGDGELFLQSEGEASRRVDVAAPIVLLSGIPSLSPDGRYLVALTRVPAVPSEWKDYADPLIHRHTLAGGPAGPSWLTRYELIDVTTGAQRVLVNAPVKPWNAAVEWSGDSRSVVLAGAYLPLEGTEGDERRTRRTRTFALDVGVPRGTVTKVTEEEGAEGLKLVGQDAIGRLVFETRQPNRKPRPGQHILFAKAGGRWARAVPPIALPAAPRIVIEQDMSTPPALFAIDPASNRRALLLDLNPQFADLQLGFVKEIEWRGSDGHLVKGGLYYPPGYVAGQRYPLVIQTHGWSREVFWIDGPWTTAFAAQPLAAKGIMVLQADESLADIDTPKEVRREVAALEGAVRYLDKQGLIDRERVGLIGFSRSGNFVMDALTHSRCSFAAAAIADGSALGYFGYLASYPFNRDLEGLNGAVPFGDGLKSWAQRSAGFSLERVQAPLRVLATGPSMLLLEWEIFVALSRLGKPVEMVYLPEGAHVLEKPWDRMTSQGGDVDWFAFWLKGEEDPDPAKADQYARWRKLREQLQASAKPAATNAAQRRPN